MQSKIREGMPIERLVVGWSEHVGDAAFERDDRHPLPTAREINYSN
jgi:hypothetical protein